MGSDDFFLVLDKVKVIMKCQIILIVCLCAFADSSVIFIFLIETFSLLKGI